MFLKEEVHKEWYNVTEVVKMATVKRRYEISDEEWERVKDLLPTDQLERQGRPPKPNRDMLNAILWIAKVERHGVTFLNDMDHGKRFMASSRSAKKRAYFKKSSTH